MNLHTGQKQTHRHRQQSYSYRRGEGGRDRCKLLHIEWMDNKVPLYSTGKYIQCPGMNHNGKGINIIVM